MELLGIEGQN